MGSAYVEHRYHINGTCKIRPLNDEELPEEIVAIDIDRDNEHDFVEVVLTQADVDAIIDVAKNRRVTAKKPSRSKP